MGCNTLRTAPARAIELADSAYPPVVENPIASYDADLNISEDDIQEIESTISILLRQYRQGPKATQDWFASMTSDQHERIVRVWGKLDEIQQKSCKVDPLGPCAGNDVPDSLMDLLTLLGGPQASELRI